MGAKTPRKVRTTAIFARKVAIGTIFGPAPVKHSTSPIFGPAQDLRGSRPTGSENRTQDSLDHVPTERRIHWRRIAQASKKCRCNFLPGLGTDLEGRRAEQAPREGRSPFEGKFRRNCKMNNTYFTGRQGRAAFPRKAAFACRNTCKMSRSAQGRGTPLDCGLSNRSCGHGKGPVHRLHERINMFFIRLHHFQFSPV